MRTYADIMSHCSMSGLNVGSGGISPLPFWYSDIVARMRTLQSTKPCPHFQPQAAEIRHRPQLLRTSDAKPDSAFSGIIEIQAISRDVYFDSL